MKFASLFVCAAAAGFAAVPTDAHMEKRVAGHALHERAADLPDVLHVKVKNLTPEDGVWNFQQQTMYQSNLWKGQISGYRFSDNSHFNVKIDGVSSSGDGAQQMSGLTLDSRENPTKLYAVVKPADAFRFDAVHDKGPCSFHMFNVPLSASSKPVWSVDMTKAQDALEKKYGVRPYGNVASAQDSQGNSYVIFSLGAPAIAKISADGKTITPWFQEKSNGSQRPGYTGVAYVPEADAVVAFGGPRALSLFRLNNSENTGDAMLEIPEIKGDFGSLSGTEKIKAIPSRGTNKTTRLIGAKAPYIYSFASSDNWKSVSFKSDTRKGFGNSDLTSIVEYGSLSARGIYGTGAYFGNGAHGGRDDYPAYRINRDLLL